MRIFLTFILLLACFSIEVTNINSTPSLKAEQNNAFPLIVQSINNFTIRTNDIDNVLKGQLKDFKLGNISTSYASISSSTVSISHYTTEKHVDNISPLKVNITKDDLSLFIIFQLKVLHIVGSKKYNCNVTVPLVQIGYIKEFDIQTGKIKVTNLKTTFSSKSFNHPVCKQSQSKKDIDRINEIVNSTQGSSIYITLQKQFEKMTGYFNDNAKDEHLSQIYETNPYIYQYYGGVNISIDVSTVMFSRVGETGLQNGLSGKLQGTSTPAVAPPEVQPGYTSFYSKQFFLNLVEYAKNRLPNWKNIKLNRQTMRNRIFNYKLLDFQVLIPTILSKYPQKYLSDIEFQCNFDAMGQLLITQEEISQNIDWRCLGSLQITAGKRETFLNFVVTLQHGLQVTVSQQYLTVLVKQLSIKNIRFDIIDNHQVTDPFTFAYYIDQGLFEFRTYTIGSSLRINSPNQQIKVLNGRGIWIG